MGAQIVRVQPGSPAEKFHLRVGDVLCSVEGHAIHDCLDYQFYSTGKTLHLEVERQGKRFKMLLRKREYEDMGVEFATYLMDNPRACHNKCIFCFIDQLPKGMRPTMYFKDDDTRLSFLTGNYVTLTNIREEEIARIVEQHISPINISVQTTDMELRKTMLHNKNADKLMGYIAQLAEGHIEMNCQIVLCKGINDGEKLEQSVRDLAVFHPWIGSMAVVPVGLTKYRKGLYPLKPFEKEDALAVIRQVETLQQENLSSIGTRFVYLGDEFYLKAELPVPAPEEYEGYPQLENGVGLMASMREEFDEALEHLSQEDMQSNHAVTLATGQAAYEYLCGMVDDLRKKCHNLKVNVYCIQNDFFGHAITVTGLVTGQDLIAQLKDKPLYGKLLICSSMLRDEGDRFLDDVTTAQVEKTLGVRLGTCNNNGQELIDYLIGRNGSWQNQ